MGNARDRFLALASKHARLPDPDDAFGWRIVRDYGAVFVTDAMPPPAAVFRSADAVRRFQDGVERGEADFDGVKVVLQKRALDALLDAREEARRLGLDVNPRGADAAIRSWEDSEALWRGRVERACDHWASLGRITPDLAGHIRSLPGVEQAPLVLELEREGIWFSTFFDKSILYSVAAPGASQHLAMLAFDVREFADPGVRDLLPRFGWFQTVVSDLPHFTFLGHDARYLTALGLRRETLAVEDQTYTFWVPSLGDGRSGNEVGD
jgi:hypothetical protein